MPSRKIITTLAILIVIAVGWGFLRPFAKNPLESNDISTGTSDHTVISVLGITDVEDELVDPKNDSWPTEIAHSSVKKQLAKLKTALESGEQVQQEVFTSPTFRARSFVADDMELTFDDGTISVQRPASGSAPSVATADFSEFVANFANGSAVDRATFKVTHITSDQGSVNTDILVEFRSRGNEHTEQTNAVWECTWQLAKSPKLTSIHVSSFERVVIPRDSSIFTDDTAAVLGRTGDFSDHILRGIGHWNVRLTGIDDMHIFGHHGVAVGDVNGDGRDDLYVCDSGGLPNRLYVQQEDGTAVDFSQQSKADWLEATTSALLVDFDNDGDQDLIAATIAGVIFAANDGGGVFRIQNAISGIPEAHSICTADYDNDGDLDLYICNYGPSGGPGSERGYEGSVPVPYNDANNGGGNMLLRNEGGFKVTDVTQQVGLDENNRRFSFAASWEDFDRDGDVDLYVANDFGRNNLYENVRGRFRDIAAAAGVEDMAGGMSVSWADFNRDGFMDIYVGNMFSAAGNRVTYQRQFTDRHRHSSTGMQRMARGNSLFASNGNRGFVDVSEQAGVTMGRWAWSSGFADLNNDGWQDLLVANGYFTSESPDDL